MNGFGHNKPAVFDMPDLDIEDNETHSHEKCPNYGDHCKQKHEWCESCRDSIHIVTNGES